MRATLLARNADDLALLRGAVEAEGHQVAIGAVRDPSRPLARELASVQGDLAIVAGDCEGADLAAIERLTAQRPGLAVLLLCAGRDPDGLIAAMRSGVDEVLHSPPIASELQGALRRVARRSAHARGAAETPGGRIVAFIACKGGSGATVLATSFAHLVASEYGKRVALIDLDLEYGDAAAFLTEKRPKATVGELARQVERLDAKLLETSMLEVAQGLWLLPAPEELEGALGIGPAQVERLVEVARSAFDIVVLDVGRNLDAVTVKALDHADVVCAVTQDLIPFIRSARRLVKSFHALGYPDDKVHLVVNRYGRRSAIAIADLEKALGVRIRHTVPNSFDEVAKAMNLGHPLLEIAPRSAVVGALRALAATLAGPAPERATRFLARHAAPEG
jgi:pilus assembly protein CpaE